MHLRSRQGVPLPASRFCHLASPILWRSWLLWLVRKQNKTFDDSRFTKWSNDTVSLLWKPLKVLYFGNPEAPGFPFQYGGYKFLELLRRVTVYGEYGTLENQSQKSPVVIVVEWQTPDHLQQKQTMASSKTEPRGLQADDSQVTSSSS